MTINTIVTILIIVFTAAVLAFCAYTYLRDRTLDEIRGDVYQLFLKAEHDPDIMMSGKKKMKWVLIQARSLLPDWLEMIISDKFLDDIVETWFREIKDLLDDGKRNKSTEKNVNE